MSVYPIDTTKVYYLHGGLHLYDIPSGESAKRIAGISQNLLEFFAQQPFSNEEEHAIPLFVAESSAEDKRRVIRQSEYLSFAHKVLRSYPGALVVFGHSLGDPDRHIVEAIQRNAQRVLAISLRPGLTAEIVRKKAYYRQHFPQADLRFFDATTHPLGDATLRVAP